MSWATGVWADDAWLGTAWALDAGVPATPKGMQPVLGRRPGIRKISIQSVSFALSGAEDPYPVYQFSNRQFIERKGHNPFD